MTKKLINILILVPIGVVLIVLCVVNRAPVSMALNPFDTGDKVLSVSAPFFVFILIAFILGIVLGSLATWFSQHKYRKSAKVKKREAAKWRAEADHQKTLPAELPPTRPLDRLPSA
ncbi:lipopolysaccharide assembly protein LapA domain-containing protein [Martelella limonii]|uniref:lipopolysaccharide assembly protein LapA domain-containing protein n=1 Tax=Martelella limonii TaxID=1647649 RepID=UPI0015803F93|nr:LapA family protein [Martelella limonii]